MNNHLCIVINMKIGDIYNVNLRDGLGEISYINQIIPIKNVDEFRISNEDRTPTIVGVSHYKSLNIDNNNLEIYLPTFTIDGGDIKQLKTKNDIDQWYLKHPNFVYVPDSNLVSNLKKNLEEDGYLVKECKTIQFNTPLNEIETLLEKINSNFLNKMLNSFLIDNCSADIFYKNRVEIYNDNKYPSFLKRDTASVLIPLGKKPKESLYKSIEKTILNYKKMNKTK